MVYAYSLLASDDFSRLLITLFWCFMSMSTNFQACQDNFLSSRVELADNRCKKFGPRSGPTECRSWSGSKLFDTWIVYLKEFFENINFEKEGADDKSMKNYPACTELKLNNHVKCIKYETYAICTGFKFCTVSAMVTVSKTVIELSHTLQAIYSMTCWKNNRLK